MLEVKKVKEDGKIKVGLSDTGVVVALGVGVAVVGGVVGYKLGVRSGMTKAKMLISEQLLMSLL